MGRKPNPLILEYFERGQKLGDSSNRYQHTCKTCGENFPKGRIDSLITHLTKKCNSIPIEERTKIVLRLHDLEIKDNDTSPSGTRLEAGRDINLPFSPSRPQNFNGLNVLAEASRQVGIDQRDVQQPFPAPRAPPKGRRRGIPLDPALEADILHNEFLNTSDDGLGVTSNGYSNPVAAAPALPSIFSYIPAQLANAGNDSQHLPGLVFHTDDSPSNNPDLSIIAASANETLANVVMPMEPEIDVASQQLPSTMFNSLNGLHALNMGQGQGQSKILTWHTLNQAPGQDDGLSPARNLQDATPQTPGGRVAALPRAIAMNPHQKSTHFVEETGTGGKTQKPKVRSRFTPDRRKQVQEVRKQGACIRCRILRKPCSDGNPCSACRSVDNPRVWKSVGCDRRKTIDIFTLYGAGLHSTLEFHDRSNIKAQINFEPFAGHIQISHQGAAPSMIAVTGLQGQKGSSAIDPLFGISLQKRHYSKSDEMFLFGIEKEELAPKLEEYVKKNAASFYSQESSHLMRSTLSLAGKLAEDNNDSLLRQVLELWIFTYILSDLNFTFNITISTAESQVIDTEHEAPPSEEYTVKHHITEANNPYSYSLLCSQLRAAAEKKADTLSKVVMTDLERRIVQHQKIGRFETFLAALILLNCAERYCWLFRTWQQDQRGSRWPLDKSPGSYTNQGEQLAERMQMLLKMRNLPPKTTVDVENGILRATGGTEDIASKWLNDIKITQSDLDRAETAEFESYKCRSLDGKFYARVLQPQTTSI